MKLYYNVHEFRKILNNKLSSPTTVINELENYCSKYPEDRAGILYLADSYIIVGNLEKAKELLNKYEESMDDEIRIDKNKIAKGYYSINMLRLLIYSKKYKEALNYIFNNYNDFPNTYNLESVKFYLRYKTNLLDFDRVNPVSYLNNQIVNYSYENFLKHIEKHLSGFDNDVVNGAIFNEEFKLEKVLEEIKKYIPSNKVLYYGNFSDRYIFKYDGCGKNRNKSTDYFLVAVIYDTDSIITMYPCVEFYDSQYVDLNYLKEETNTRKLSRIDRFNKRYNL